MDRPADDLRLVGDATKVDPDRQLHLDPAQRLLDGSAHLSDVGAGGHRGAKQHRFSALIAGLGGGWILEASLDTGDVAQPERLLSRPQAQFANILDRAQPALNVDANGSFTG